jgi:tRNA A58 N-methylase Trm61
MISVRGIDGRGKMISDVGNGSGFLSKALHTAASMRGDVVVLFYTKKIAENVLSWIARSATGQGHVPLGVGVSITKGDILFPHHTYSCTYELGT